MKRGLFIFAALLFASVAATGCRNRQKEATQPTTQAQPVQATLPQPTKPSLQSYFNKRTYTSRYNSPVGGIEDSTETISGNVDGCSVHVIEEGTILITSHGETTGGEGASRQECTIDLSALPDTAIKLVSWTPTPGASPQWRVQFDRLCPFYVSSTADPLDMKLNITFPSKSDAEQWRSGVLDAVHSNCRNGH